jgi:transposase
VRRREGPEWRARRKRFGGWHTIYTRMNRWAKAGVLDRLFEEFRRQQRVGIMIEAVSVDSTTVKVNPDRTEAQKAAHKRSDDLGADGQRRFIWLPRTFERL